MGGSRALTKNPNKAKKRTFKSAFHGDQSEQARESKKE